MTLTARILLLVLLALAPAFAVQVYNEQVLRAARADVVQAAARRFGRAVSADLAQFAESVGQVLDVLAEEPAVRDLDAAGCSAYLASVKSRLTGAVIIVVTDTEGSLVCNSRGASPGSYSLADRRYFRKIMASGEPAIGEYVISRGTGLPMIQFAQTLRNRAGKIVGVINAGFEPDFLARRVMQIGLPREATVTIVDRTGTVIVRLPDAENWVGRRVPQDYVDGLQRTLDLGGVGEMSGLRGNLRITGVDQPKGTLDGVTVAVALSREIAFADIDAANRRGVVLILFGVVFAVLAALIGGRALIRRPARRLLRAAEAWRSGDLGARSGLRGSSEFGQLGQGFDAMAVALQRHEQDLKAELSRSRSLQEQQVTMLHELNHRVKNTLATVQSLARQSRGGEEQVVQLENRILALSKTHDLLTRRDWTRAPLRQVLENELSPYRNGAGQYELIGEDVELPPRYVLALGMTAHELTTNAAKYGALSTQQGRVDVRWQVSRTDVGTLRLRIEWRERDGPPVTRPDRRGFGSRLITGGVARELSGEVRLDFDTDGLRCTIDVPLEDATPPQATTH